MKQKKGYVETVLQQGILMIILGLVLGFIMLIVSGIFSASSQLPWAATTAHASIFDLGINKQHKITNLKVSTKPQLVKVIQVADDNTLVVKGKYTNPKRVSLYLTVLPSKDAFVGSSAHSYLKKSVINKNVYIFNDKQAPERKIPVVYVERENQLIQSRLLRKGYAVIYNYNGSEKYYHQFVKDQDYAQQNSYGVWIRPGYVTDNGYNNRIGDN